MNRISWSVLLVWFVAGTVHAQYERTYQGKTLEQWTKQLQDPLPKNRLSAVYALSAIGPDGLPGLTTALKDQDVQVRFAAAKIMATRDQGGKEAVNVLVELLKEPNLILRFAVAKTLAGLREPRLEAVPVLIQVLESPDPTQQQHSSARYYLQQLGPLGQAANAVLLKQLVDKNPSNRRGAAETLAKINPQGGEVVPALIQAMNDSQTGDNAFWALERIGKGALPELAKTLKVPKTPYKVIQGTADLLVLAQMQNKEELPKLKNSDLMYSRRFLYPMFKLGAEGLPLLHKALQKRNGEWTNNLLNSIAPFEGRKNDLGDQQNVAVIALVLKESEKFYAVYAADILGKLGSQAVPTLTEALKHKEWEVRQKAADGLGGLGLRAKLAVPALLQALTDSDEDVRASAATALMRIDRHNPEVAAALIEMVKDKHPTVRKQVAAVLGIIAPNNPKAVQALGIALKDMEETVRDTAGTTLRQLGAAAKDALPALIHRLQDDKKEHTRTAATLGKLGPLAKDALPALREALVKQEPCTRQYVARALWEISGESKEGTPIIVAGLQDKEARVRWCAAHVAGDVVSAAKETSPHLFQLARADKDESIRKEASDSLVRLGKQVVPFLVETLKEQEVAKKTWALLFLNRIGPGAQEATPALMAALQDTNANVRAWAANCLGSVNAPAKDALPVLKQALADKFLQVRQWAIFSLEKYGLEGMQIILPALEDADATVRTKAFTALGKLGPRAKDAVPGLIRLLKTKGYVGRNQVIWALGRIGPEARAAVPGLVEIVEQIPTLRPHALKALRDIEPPANEVMPTLLRMLQDKEASVRTAAAEHLGDLGKDGVAALGQALNKTMSRQEAVHVLTRLGPQAEGALPELLEAWWPYGQALSPDGRWIASSSRSTVQLWNAATLQEVARLPGHHKELRGVAFAADGNTLVAITEEGQIKLWDVSGLPGKNPTLLKNFRDESRAGYVRSLALSPDGKTLATIQTNGTVYLHDLSGDKLQSNLLRKKEGGYTFSGVAFAPNGKMLAEWTEGSVRLWDLSGKQPRQRDEVFISSSDVNLVFSPDSKTFVFATAGKVHLWDVSGEKLQKLSILETAKGVSSPPWVAFSPDGKTLLTLDFNIALRLWDLSAAPPTAVAATEIKEPRIFSAGRETMVWNGKQLTFVGREGSGGCKLLVQSWDFVGGKFKQRLALVEKQQTVQDLAFARDGKTLAVISGFSSQTVKLWELSGAYPRQLGTVGSPYNDIHGVHFTPEGKTVVLSGRMDSFDEKNKCQVELWDLAAGQPKVCARIKEGSGTLRAAKWAALSPDGHTLALALQFNPDDLVFWDLSGAEPKRKGNLRLNSDNPTLNSEQPTMAFAPNSKLLAVAAYDSAGSGITLVDLSGPQAKTGKLFFAKESARQDRVTSLAFAPDGKVLVAGTNKEKAWLWDLSGTEPKVRAALAGHTADEKYPISVTFAPDGLKVATSDSEGRVVVWDAKTAKPLHTWQLAGPVRRVAFTRDSRHLATANSNGTVYILRLPK